MSVRPRRPARHASRPGRRAAAGHRLLRRAPRPSDPAQQVSFGTSGHRGSSLRTAFNDDHIVATSQAICDYRAASRHRRPAVPRPGHARAVRAGVVERAGGVRRQRRDRAGRQPRTATRRRRRCRTRSCAHNRGRTGGLADGVVVTPSHNPPDGRRLQVQPAQRRARPTPTSPGGSRTGPTSCSPPACTEVRRVPYARARAADTTGRYDFLDAYVDDLPRRRSTSTRSGRPGCASAPTRSAAPAWPTGARSPSRHGLDLTVVNPLVDPTWRFMTLDWDGKIRMDCSSPYAMASLIDARGRLPDRHRQRRGRRPARHRHPRRRPDEPQPLPRGRDLLPVRAPATAGRPDAAIGKTLVSSSMIDRVAADLGRRLIEVPVGLQVVRARPARRLGRLRRRGERRRVVPAPRRRHLDHRQGRHPALPARLGDHRGDRPDARASTTPS